MLRTYRGVTPRVHETAYVDASAQVIGDVEIGEQSSIWMNVVMRGDVHRIRVGSRTKVKRQLTHAEVMSILDYSERYVGYRLDYMQA